MFTAASLEMEVVSVVAKVLKIVSSILSVKLLLLLLICVSYPVLAGTNVAISSAISMQFEVHNLLVKKMPVLCKSIVITVRLPLRFGCHYCEFCLTVCSQVKFIRTPLAIVKVISNNGFKIILTS